MNRKALLTILGAAFLQSAAAQAGYVSVRATTGVTPEAERKLAEIAEPLIVNVAAGVDPLEAARQLCGRLTPSYIDILKQANTSLAVADRDRAIKVPACFVVRPNARISVLEGEVLQSFAKRTVGVAGPQTLGRLSQANQWIGSAASEGAAPLSTARALIVPFATEGAIYRLKSASAANPQTALSELRDVLNDAPGSAVLDPELRLESDIDPAKSVPVACPSATTIPASAWPFDAAAVAAALTRNDELRRTLNLPEAEFALIALADNGVDGLGTVFPTNVLVASSGEIPNDQKDNDTNGFVDDVYGANVMTRQAPVPLAGKDPWHGTHLAGIALGRRGFISSPAAAVIGRRVRLLPISMVQKRVTGSLQTGNVTTYPLLPEAVEKAYAFALSRHADVVNFSVSTDDELQNLRGKLATSPPILVIAAAGNLATNFAAEYRYPAAYGGDAQGPLRFPVLSVAAHDQRACLTAFSGRGRSKIDIAAPGTDILSNDLGASSRTASGSSQATALVSLAAALLSSEGLKDPLAIKQRLVASVDPKAGLEPYVASGGALNIVKALSLYEDLLELTNGELERGQIESRPTLSELCPDQGNTPGTILKISSGSGGLKVLVRYPNGNLGRLDCPQSNRTLNYVDADGAHLIALTATADIVFRN